MITKFWNQAVLALKASRDPKLQELGQQLEAKGSSYAPTAHSRAIPIYDGKGGSLAITGKRAEAHEAAEQIALEAKKFSLSLSYSLDGPSGLSAEGRVAKDLFCLIYYCAFIAALEN